jgi:hypothetical protein
MQNRGGATVAMLGWLGGLAGAIAGLHRLGASLPATAVTDPDLELALGAGLRLAGLAVGYWLAASTLIYLAASLSRVPALARAAATFTLPSVRRLSQKLAAPALAAALTAPVLTGPALASVAPGYVPVPAGDPPPSTATTSPPTPTTPSPATSTTTTTTPTPTPAATTTPPAPPRPLPSPGVEHAGQQDPRGRLVVVRPGDHMWGLARARLIEEWGRVPSSAEIIPYWVKVVEANRERIRSGDPDLIFPGETLLLPEV